MISIKTKNIKFVLFTIVIISLIIGYFPLKIAKDPSKYDLNSKEYIVCKEIRITGYNWIRITDRKTKDLQHSIGNEHFNFVDKTPLDSIYNLDLSNMYVVYGKQLSEPIEDEFYENVRYTCEDWEILYPIKRPRSIIARILPKKYLCTWDIIEKFSGFGVLAFYVLYFSFVSIYVCFMLYKYGKLVFKKIS